MTLEELARRLDDLEIRYAFQEDTIRQLDEVVRVQADRIGELTRELRDVREQQKQPQGPEAPAEEQVPPHYGG